MRKFEVEVTRTDKYIIEIDEDKMDKELIKDYERDFHQLGDDKIKRLAKDIGSMAMDNDGYFEGVGYVRIDGLTFGQECEEGIDVKTEMLEDYDVEIKEI